MDAMLPTSPATGIALASLAENEPLLPLGNSYRAGMGGGGKSLVYNELDCFYIHFSGAVPDSFPARLFYVPTNGRDAMHCVSTPGGEGVSKKIVIGNM